MPQFLFASALDRDATTFSSRLHPTTWLIAVGCMTVIIFSTMNFLALIGLLALLFLFVMVDGMPRKSTFTVLLVLIPLCFFITLIQALTDPEQIIARFDLLGMGVLVSAHGIVVGMAITIRVALMALIMTIFFTVVHPVKLTRALYDLGMPFKFAYTFVLALRFLPLILDELSTINNAQKSRGYDIDRVNPAMKVAKMFPLTIPLILSALKRSDTIALAMDLKAFNAYPQRTFFIGLQKGSSDTITRAVCVVAMVFFVIVTFQGIL
ncbi:MAG TPA: energy-coupling factor transporter transmembrane component T [Chloroflexota bacterium]|nr:energy-coupling factor transporter transmembrane component T [Chloroflexota bacterium]